MRIDSLPASVPLLPIETQSSASCAAASSVVPAISQSVSFSASVSMQHNFVDTRTDRSPYIEAFFDEASSLKKMRKAFNAAMKDLVKTMKGEGDPTHESEGLARARRMGQIYAAMQVNLDDLQAEIAYRTAVAQAPKDDSGEPDETQLPERPELRAETDEADREASDKRRTKGGDLSTFSVDIKV